MNGLKALIQLLIYMLNIPKENNVFTETTSCSDKKKKIQSSLSQMQDHIGHYFHQTMTEILCVSQEFLTIRKFLSSGREMGLEWPAACGNIYKSTQQSLMAWKQMDIPLQQWKETFQFGCVCLWNKCLQRKTPFGLLEHCQTTYVFTEESSTASHCKLPL